MGVRTFNKVLCVVSVVFILFILKLILLETARTNDGNVTAGPSLTQAQSDVINAKQLNINMDGSDPHFPINLQRVCFQKRRVELVICVPVARHAFEQRKAVRETWGSYASKVENSANLVFFIGLKGGKESPDIESKILTEYQTHNDIVQGNYVDYYYNLTLKSISIVRWVDSYCHNSEYMLKVDADVYVIIPNLVKLLRDANRNYNSVPFTLGSYQPKNIPKRNPASKWYVSYRDFPNNSYPPYMIGAGYALSRTAYSGIARATYEIKPFVFEDIYITGLCGKKAGVRYVNDKEQFLHKFKGGNCDIKRKTLAHGYTPTGLRKLHKDLNNAQC